jgi:hypothetical protein
MADETATRCAHPGCTCHTQEGARYCSEACHQSAESGVQNGCRCGHAGCTASAYVRRRPGGDAQRAGARGHSHAR